MAFKVTPGMAARSKAIMGREPAPLSSTEVPPGFGTLGRMVEQQNRVQRGEPHDIEAVLLSLAIGSGVPQDSAQEAVNAYFAFVLESRQNPDAISDEDAEDWFLRYAAAKQSDTGLKVSGRYGGPPTHDPKLREMARRIAGRGHGGSTPSGMND